MFKSILFAISIFWLMDFMNMGFMKPFDTTYPLNGLFWLCTLIIAIGFISVDIEITEG